MRLKIRLRCLEGAVLLLLVSLIGQGIWIYKLPQIGFFNAKVLIGEQARRFAQAHPDEAQAQMQRFMFELENKMNQLPESLVLVDGRYVIKPGKAKDYTQVFEQALAREK